MVYLPLLALTFESEKAMVERTQDTFQKGHKSTLTMKNERSPDFFLSLAILYLLIGD